MQLSRYEIDGTHKVKEKKDKGKEKEKAKGGYDDDFAVVLRFAPEAETPQPVVVENAALSKERHAIPETAKNPAPETKKEKVCTLLDHLACAHHSGTVRVEFACLRAPLRSRRAAPSCAARPPHFGRP